MVIVERNARADCSRLAFFNHVNTTDTRLFSSRQQRTLLYLRYFRKHAHDRAAAEVRKTAARCPDEVVEHGPRSFKIGDDTVNERRNHGDIARLASLHLVRFVADRDDFAGNLVNSDDRWLVNDDATPAHGNDRARRTHIDGHRIGDEVLEGVEAEEGFSFPDERHKKE